MIKDTLIWYEKHRPRELSELALSLKIKNAFSDYIKQGEIPHLLFYGPAGSGKTTLANILIDKCSGRKLIMNASSEDRGVQTIKQKVRQFASTIKKGDKLNIVFFDEANGLTYDAQEALKNTIERYQSNCRFIFATNIFDKITQPIVSRCQVFEFGIIPERTMANNVLDILDAERVKYEMSDVDKIVEKFYPDFRSIINTVQLCSRGGVLRPKQALTKAGDTDMLHKLINKGKLLEIRKLVAGHYDFLWAYRYLFNEYIKMEVPVEGRSEAAIMVAEYLHRNSTIIDKEINFTACIIELMGIICTDIDFG